MTRLLRFRFTFLAASYRTISGWLVLLIGLGGLSLPSWAQCPTGPVSLRTQADVKAFPPACSALPNSLTIWGDDIIDLSPLTNLQTIGGDLEIYANQKLVGLKGLEKLRAISGELRIAFNPQLSSLSGLSQLTSLSLGLDISQNPQLGSLAGLEKLTTLSGGLNIDYNDQLSSIRSLSQASISGFVNISYNPQLESLTGLEKLTALPEGIYIESNEQLTDISALSQVTSISGELRITNNPQLGQCAIQAICQYLAITPDLTGIYNNAPGCNSIEEIQQHCPAVPWVLGFSLIDADSDQPLQVLIDA